MRVYIAGAYTASTQAKIKANVHYAIEVGNRIAEMGYDVFVPHQTWIWEQDFPHPYDFWMKQDRAWLEVSDVLVRLDNESPGADEEMEYAVQLGLLVYTEKEFFRKFHPVCNSSLIPKGLDTKGE